MTIITRERLLKIKQWRETYGAGHNVTLPAEEAEELARIVLASLDAKPVAWTDEQELRDVAKDGCGYMFTVNPITPNADPRRIIKLYSTPPASVVPDEWITELCGEEFDDLSAGQGYRMGWNACRASMLQGKFRDLSQPVDPQVTEYEQIMLQAGWVMVPVEPTDEMIAAAMECDDVVFDSKDPTAFCVQFREIYYAMVDAAPKQENI